MSFVISRLHNVLFAEVRTLKSTPGSRLNVTPAAHGASSRMSLSPGSLRRLILRSHASKTQTHNSSVRIRGEGRKAER